METEDRRASICMHWEISQTSRLAEGPPPRQKPSSYLFWGAARAPFGPVVSPMPPDPNASLSSVRSAPQSSQITASIHRPSRQAQTHSLSPCFSPSNTRIQAPPPRFYGFLATANWGCLLEPYCRAVCWLDNWFFSNEDDGNDFFIPLYKHHRLPLSEYSLVMLVLPKQRKRSVPENEILMEIIFIFSVVKCFT